MHLTRRGLLGAVGVAGVCGVAGTAAGRGEAGQSGEGTWTTTYDAGDTEYADAAAHRGDAVLLAGRSFEDETTAYWTLELGPDGERRAATTFGRETRNSVNAVLPTPGGVVVAGTDFGPEDGVTAPWTPWVAEVGPNGVEWTYGKEEVERDHRVGGATRTSDGDFVVVGSRDFRDPWTLRLADDGSVLRERTPDRPEPTEFRDVTSVGNDVVVGGSVGESEESTASLARLGGDGTTRWERTYDDADGVDPTRVRAVAADGDGIALALDGVANGDFGPVVGRADGAGSLEWATYLFSSQMTVAQSVAPVDDGYLVGGNFAHGDNDDDYWLATVDRDGTVRWRARYDDGGYLGDLLGDGSHALFAGSDGDDATARRFDPAASPWRSEDRESTGGAKAGTTATIDGTVDEGTSTGDATTEETATTGTPGFGVAEAVAGVASLELVRRHRGD